MAKAKKPTKTRPKTYEQPLTVKGSFMDIMNASVKNSDKDAPKPLLYPAGVFVSLKDYVDMHKIIATREDENSTIPQGVDYVVQQAFDRNGPLKDGPIRHISEDDIAQ